MTFCGYNDTMAAAMKRFAIGLAIQCDKRAARENKTTAQVVVAETEELDMVVRLLSASPKRVKFTGIIGFAMLVRDLFAQVGKVVEANPSTSADDVFAQVIEPFNTLMFELDRHYFDQPEQSGTEAKMASLVALAEERV